MKLNGQRIIILGGSSGIGLATAQAAAQEGASVVIASSRKARVDEALVTLPASAEGHALDLRDEQAVKAFFALGGAVAICVGIEVGAISSVTRLPHQAARSMI